MCLRYALGLAVLAAPAVAAQPDLSISAFSEDASGDPGDRITIGYTATLTGAEQIEDVPVGFYFSTDATFSPDDTFSEREEVNTEQGDPESDNEQINVPASLAGGEYFILVVIDDLDLVAESNESNNTAAIPFTVGDGGTGGGADLTVTSLTLERAAGAPGNQLGGEYVLANLGAELAGASEVGVYLSTDAALSADDAFLTSQGAPAVGASGSVSGSFQFTVPITLAPGDYVLLAVADDGDALAETDESNNVASTPFRIVPRGRRPAQRRAAPMQAQASASVRVVGVAPNPVADRATVRFALDAAGPARLAVVDALGREVAVLAQGRHAAGVHDASWDAARLAPGAYVLRLDTPGQVTVWTATVAR